MEYAFAPRFLRSFKRLPKSVQDDALYAIDQFKKDSHTPHLRLHKLSGKLKKYHAFSVNFSYRIIVHIHQTEVWFINVGSHDMYQ